jgi:hypothetical protein
MRWFGRRLNEVCLRRGLDLGKYPESMVRECGDRLPKFTDEQWKLVKGSSDL